MRDKGKKSGKKGLKD
jgi:hypothetical protein